MYLFLCVTVQCDRHYSCAALSVTDSLCQSQPPVRKCHVGHSSPASSQTGSLQGRSSPLHCSTGLRSAAGRSRASWTRRLWQCRQGGVYVCRGRVVAKAEDRLWLDMCQLMMWQEQIKKWVCLWETRSSKLEAVTDSVFL